MIRYKTLCILGRQPALGVAELESLYGADNLEPADGGALLDVAAADINFEHLGGVIKTARILTTLPSTDWPSALNYLKKAIPEQLVHVEGKLTLGLSVYGVAVTLDQLNKDALALKKVVKSTGKPARIVPNKTLTLNSAQVLHNKLTHRGGWELILFKHGEKTIVAQTLFVQDIEAYGARDQARPKRDARVGMLPPKLAQIIVNLAVGQPDGDKPMRVLDPFCGTGVILQEAALMGYHALGTDNDPRMVDYAKQNLKWLFDKHPGLETQVAIELADATSYHWPRFSVVASETYLGRPLSTLPPRDKLQGIINDTNTVLRKFLRNLAPQLKTGQRLVLAVPAWRSSSSQLIELPLIDQLTDMGYAYLDLKHVSRDQLIYYREGQVVARRILRLHKA